MHVEDRGAGVRGDSRGSTTDGCGNTVDCPNLCESGFTCDGNTCYLPGGCGQCPTGYMCEWGTGGAPGVCVVNHRCPFGEKYCAGKCIAEGAYCP